MEKRRTLRPYRAMVTMVWATQCAMDVVDVADPLQPAEGLVRGFMSIQCVGKHDAVVTATDLQPMQGVPVLGKALVDLIRRLGHDLVGRHIAAALAHRLFARLRAAAHRRRNCSLGCHRTRLHIAQV